MRRAAPFFLLVLAACGSGQLALEQAEATDIERGFELPIATNAESPIFYPVDLFEQEVEGAVTLRLYVTETGTVVPESTQVARTSGLPMLDSAAIAGVAEMRFTPARRNGIPVATLLLQPVYFRHPARAGGGEQP